MKKNEFKKPKIIYEVIGRNQDGDWETIKCSLRSLKEARKVAKKQIKEFTTIDINLIIDDDLTETYDIDGKIR